LGWRDESDRLSQCDTDEILPADSWLFGWGFPLPSRLAEVAAQRAQPEIKVSRRVGAFPSSIEDVQRLGNQLRCARRSA
jgi:hypothetical protein